MYAVQSVILHNKFDIAKWYLLTIFLLVALPSKNLNYLFQWGKLQRERVNKTDKNRGYELSFACNTDNWSFINIYSVQPVAIFAVRNKWEQKTALWLDRLLKAALASYD